LKFEFKVIVLYLLIALVVINWFSGWNYLHQIDGRFKLNPERHLQDALYFWRDSTGFGYATSDFLSVPFYLWQTVLLKFFKSFLDSWQSLVLSQFVMCYLIVIFGLVFAFLFFKEFYYTFFSNGSTTINIYTKIILFLLPILYIFNQYTLLFIFHRFTSWTFMWIGFPFLGYLFLRYLKTGSMKYILYTGIATFLTPVICGGFHITGLPNLIFIYILLPLFFIAHDYTNKSRYILRCFVFVGLFLLLNLWTLAPQILGMEYMVQSAQISLSTDKMALQYSSQFTNILNIFRNFGHPSIYTAIKPIYAMYDNIPFVWINFYYINIVQALTLFYPILLALPLVWLFSEKQKHLKYGYLLVFIVMLILIFIMKGVTDPFPDSGELLLKISSVFFRKPYTRLIHIFIFLYFIVLFYIFHKLSIILKNKHYFMIIIALLGGFFLFMSYPLFNGDVIHPSDRIDLSNTSYWSLENQLNSKGLDFDKYRVLIMPFTVDSRESTYNISGKLNHPNDKSLFYSATSNTRVVRFPRSNSDSEFLNMLYNLMKEQKYNEFVDISKNMNIGYIVLNKDASSAVIIGSKEKEIIQLSSVFIKNLEEKEKIIKILETENIAFYKINGIPKEMIFISSFGFNKTPDNLFQVNEQTSENFYYEKNSPVLWEIKINSSEPFMLSFVNGFDPLWEARVYKDGKMMETVASTKLYGLINGFWINETGELDIELNYKPQEWFNYSFTISVFTFIICFIVFVYDYKKLRKK